MVGASVACMIPVRGFFIPRFKKEDFGYCCFSPEKRKGIVCGEGVQEVHAPNRCFLPCSVAQEFPHPPLHRACVPREGIQLTVPFPLESLEEQHIVLVRA